MQEPASPHTLLNIINPLKEKGSTMSKPNIVVSTVSLQALEYRIQQIGRLADSLDILAFEVRQVSNYLKDAYKNLRLEEEN